MQPDEARRLWEQAMQEQADALHTDLDNASTDAEDALVRELTRELEVAEDVGAMRSAEVEREALNLAWLHDADDVVAALTECETAIIEDHHTYAEDFEDDEAEHVARHDVRERALLGVLRVYVRAWLTCLHTHALVPPESWTTTSHEPLIAPEDRYASQEAERPPL